MEPYYLNNVLKVFGFEVTTFPNGIGEAFDKLVKTIGGFDRPFYALSEMKEGRVMYIVAALEETDGEAEKYQCNRYVIEKGAYMTETIKNWTTKTESIKDVFHKMMEDSRVDKTKPCVEWYKNDDEMVCMVRSRASI